MDPQPRTGRQIPHPSPRNHANVRSRRPSPPLHDAGAAPALRPNGAAQASPGQRPAVRVPEYTSNQALKGRLSRNPAVENGNRFTRRRGGAENEPLEDRQASHRLVTGCKARDQPLSLRSPRLRVRRLLHGYGSAAPALRPNGATQASPGQRPAVRVPEYTPNQALKGRLSRNPAVENGNRFTRRRGGAENGPLEGRQASHRLVTGCRGCKARDQLLSLRSPRLRVRRLLHGYGSAAPALRPNGAAQASPGQRPADRVPEHMIFPSPERAAQPRHSCNLCPRSPISPFQGSGTRMSPIRGALPRAVVGRPLGAKVTSFSA
jgi:hypothetical protein